MIPLRLPSFAYRTKQALSKTYILDLIKDKYVLLTPEEWVRQHILYYLIRHLGYPKGLFCLERKIQKITTKYRPDVVFFDKYGMAKMIIECKAPYVKITETILYQVIQYNRQLPVNVIVVTNGLTHFCWQFKKERGQFEAIHCIPTYQTRL
ncbi:type I restriction enzyme HsdR N-terminal domain-containing protein [Candidatus Cardinium hertigii]|uniref:Type I restriction enzyme R protein N-terminal domain-containing protein n=1 Tax=Candidatus Cardinium hertigii TaxID=247481 RepID=A0A2Z3L995_9BACT|nr:type I restriction enzyme HsdR N-terminal domain-containing protein [Candidatus Cardinium hertigii]AWN81951.1 hypothetical protein DK880_00637 [Candidatus Cardinium hertigii]